MQGEREGGARTGTVHGVSSSPVGPWLTHGQADGSEVWQVALQGCFCDGLRGGPEAPGLTLTGMGHAHPERPKNPGDEITEVSPESQNPCSPRMFPCSVTEIGRNARFRVTR